MSDDNVKSLDFLELIAHYEMANNVPYLPIQVMTF
jgi:hypothetical protein